MEQNNQSLEKTDAEWRALLSEEEYRVLRLKGTERPHTGKYNLHFEEGTYKCKGCGTPLFESDMKFESDCGWPSFDKAIEGTITYKKDTSFGMVRTEILCSKCGGHLGHVFNDGPTATGKRYCVNSVSIDFKDQ
ncbi:peptide-methionine (R)-S-oxide reductase MsrB [Zhouia amylolytica]|uniref:peptide-methionine (R)-S-oxide reductase n=2 Tax=Zhouia amylolytica TaxID=376730 RepID=W2UT85_9FLAO|nr:peptide-methionine (R)-S-oxide reductase MsrB [Zhouia amylolytica]ETN96547.1 peptide methionine sulfoxide reductase [Zhouia amylolytica AD3]